MDSSFGTWASDLVSTHTEKYFRNLIKSTWNQIVFTIFRLIWIQTDVRLVHNGGTSGAPLKPPRDDSVLRALSTLRGLRGAPEVPPLCRETQSLGQQMLEFSCENATVGRNGLTTFHVSSYMHSPDSWHPCTWGTPGGGGPPSRAAAQTPPPPACAAPASIPNLLGERGWYLELFIFSVIFHIDRFELSSII